MASTNYKTRVIVREHTTDTVTGSYFLLVKAKSVPSPVGTPNNVESTTMEDGAQTFEEGIKQSSSKEFTGNLEKEYLDKITALKGKTLDVFWLYGTDGVGGVAKYVCQGTAVATPSDVSGTDAILEMTVTVTPKTEAELVTDKYTVTDGGNGTFTVAEA